MKLKKADYLFKSESSLAGAPRRAWYFLRHLPEQLKWGLLNSGYKCALNPQQVLFMLFSLLLYYFKHSTNVLVKIDALFVILH